MVFGNKKIFKNLAGDMHIGNNAPEGFSETIIEDVSSRLNNLEGRKIWRCHVCNDIRIANEPLQTCPTCLQQDAYVEINMQEIKSLLEIK